MKHAVNSALCLILVLILSSMTLSGCGKQDTSSEVQNTDAPAETAEVVVTVEPTVTSESIEAAELAEPAIATYGLDQVQLNSIYMLNYLAVVTQEIIDSSNNRLNLEEIYSILENYTRKSAVNEDTKDQMSFLFDAIRDYRTLSHKRDRLLYIYQQNQAQALRNAIPNPVGILSAAQSKGWKGLAISAIYLAVDSAASYKSFVAENDLNYLLSNWELDDSEEQILYNLRSETFGYLVDMTNRFNLPDDLVLNKNNAEEFIDIKQESNPRSRIISLEEKQDEYQGLAEYWLVLAASYYDQAISKSGTPEDYAKCLEAVNTYIALPANILLKDRPLAKVLPMAIAAAEATMDTEDYVHIAENYASLIFENTETNDWELRYFSALTYAELFELTNDTKYLKEAYRIARFNMNHLAKTQKAMNAAYFEEVPVQPVPTPKAPKDPTQEEQQEIDDITQYNTQLENERKVALPPIYEPLLLNCELLLGISQQMEYSEDMRLELDDVLHENDTAIFMVPTVDNLYRFNVAPVDVSESNIDIDIGSGEEITIPAKYLADGFSVRVTITNPSTQETSVFEKWNVASVERKDKHDIETFSAKLKCDEIKGFKYKIGMTISIEVIAAGNCSPQVLVFAYDVINAKDSLIDKIGFWNRDYAFQRK